MFLTILDVMHVIPESGALSKRVEKLESDLSACMGTQKGLLDKIKALVKENSAAKTEIGKLTGTVEILTQILRNAGLMGVQTQPQQVFAAATPLPRPQLETPRSGATADELKGVFSGCLKELFESFDLRGLSPSDRRRPIQTPQQRGVAFLETPQQTPYTPGMFSPAIGNVQGLLGTPIPHQRETAPASVLHTEHRYPEDPRNPLYGQAQRREQTSEEGLHRSGSYYSSSGQEQPSLEQTATGLLHLRQQQQFQR